MSVAHTYAGKMEHFDYRVEYEYVFDDVLMPWERGFTTRSSSMALEAKPPLRHPTVGCVVATLRI